MNIPLPPHTGDDIYSIVIDEIISPILDRYSPEFLILQFGGVDAHTGDELGILDLSTASYLKVLGTVHEAAHRHANGKLVMTGGGGYDVWNTVKTWFLAIVMLTEPNRLQQYSEYLDPEPTRTPGVTTRSHST